MGCAATNRHIGRVALITSTLTLVCDGMQTMRSAGEGWDGKIEGNPIMGDRPSVAVVGTYFVAVVALNAAAWVLTPERYRAPLPVVVTAAQAHQIAHNARNHTGLCGM